LEFVQPIRDKKKIEQMKLYLKSHSLRDFTLFTLGINSGLRISDLLKMKVSDILDENGKVRDRITLREKKTGKMKTFPFSSNVIKALKEYVIFIDTTQTALFASRKGEGAITRQQAYRILNEAAKAVGIKESIATHSLRKTFGYQAYEAGVDITRIQSILNHSSPKETLRYIGITQDELDDVYMELNL
jgi:site-specific recombinase XerD